MRERYAAETLILLQTAGEKWKKPKVEKEDVPETHKGERQKKKVERNEFGEKGKTN